MFHCFISSCICVLFCLSSTVISVNKRFEKIAGFQLLMTGCLSMMQLQEAGVTLNNEQQRLDILESEADQRFVCLLIEILTSALRVVVFLRVFTVTLQFSLCTWHPY